MNAKKFFKDFIFFFALFYVAVTAYNHFFGPKDEPKVLPKGAQMVEIKPVKKKVAVGNLPMVKIENISTETVSFSEPCTREGSFDIRLAHGDGVELFKTGDCGHLPEFSIEPDESYTLGLPEINQDYFSEPGVYQMHFTFDEGQAAVSEPITIKKAGAFRRFFRTVITRPIFNALVWLTKVVPDNSFGISIILITLAVRLILFIPNQRSMRSQRKLQQIQPKLDEIKKKFKGNQQMIAMQTMALYKENKINPLSSCFPILLQMPFLLGVYYIVSDGLSPHLTHLLYGWNTASDLLGANTAFFWLNLDKIDPTYIFPVIVALAQWGAIRLSFVRNKKKQQPKETKPATKDAAPNPMKNMNQTMQWIMPIMIGFFAASLPAGVGVYWLTSTVFGIGQQWYVNKSLSKPQVKRKTS